MIKNVRPALLSVILLILISGYALFLEPLIGLADNGDFYRVMVPNNLNYEAERNTNDYFGYFNHKYNKLQYFNDLEGTAKSTQNVVLQTAIKIDDIFTRDTKFDIRFYAAICLLVLALAVYWLVEIAEKMTDIKIVKYFIAVAAVFLFGDIGYTSYFNSFFGESVAYPFFLLSIAALLKLVNEKNFQVKYLLIFAFATFMFMGAKNQFALNGILAFLLLTALIFIRTEKKNKIIAMILGGILLVSTCFLYFEIDENIYLINKYHMITRGALLFEPKPEEILNELGIDEQYALLAGTIYYDSTPVADPRDEVLLNDFYSKYDIISVAAYYFKNPAAFSKMMTFGWKNSFMIRPEVLGNFERDSGFAYGQRSNYFSLWSTVKENVFPKKPGFIYTFLLICVVLSINRLVKLKNLTLKKAWYTELIMLYVFLTGFSQILISFIGAGDTDLRKHLFMNTLALDLLFYFNFTYLITILVKKTEKRLEKEEKHDKKV